MINSIRQNFTRAYRAWENFTRNERQRVLVLTSTIYAIKEETEQMALALGVAQSCRASIDTCNGECCRLHFPKTFTAVDFLIAIEGLTPECRENLTHRMMGDPLQDRKCIFLEPNGCLLSFKNRPMVCTNAYPCFVNREYWGFKESGNQRARLVFNELDRLIPSVDY